MASLKRINSSQKSLSSRVESHLDYLPALVRRKDELPVPDGILCRLNQDWISSQRLDRCDRTVRRDGRPKLYNPGDVHPLGQIRIHGRHPGHDFASLLRCSILCGSGSPGQKEQENEDEEMAHKSALIRLVCGEFRSKSACGENYEGHEE
jgi:hypothetical protein